MLGDGGGEEYGVWWDSELLFVPFAELRHLFFDGLATSTPFMKYQGMHTWAEVM